MGVQLIVARQTRLIIFFLASTVALVASANEDVMVILQGIGEQCAAEHRYDWQRPAEVEEKALAVGEKAWRQCVYAGIRRDVVPISGVPDEYERIIARDIEFTQAIEAGEMSRVERWRRNRKARDLVLANETIAEETGQELEKDLAEKQNEQLSEFMNDQVDMMLRVQTRPNAAHFR
jgi:hypothetical protein